MLSVKTITENDYCVSCGACVHICPGGNIQMEYNDGRGKWEAAVQNLQKCSRCNGGENCLFVCPSHDVNYMDLAESDKNRLLGKIENIFNGYSKNQKNRFNASSGGFIREVCRSLLEQGKIDGIISLMDHESQDYLPQIVKDIWDMPNSIYHNINFENSLKLLKETEGLFLIIGLPCQITSIEKIGKTQRFQHINNKIFAKIALFCGYSFDRVNVEAFGFYNHFQTKTITYREKGRYRKTRISNENRTLLFDVFNPRTVREKIVNSIFFDKFLCQNHCLYCVDHLGYCADIAVGDAWQKRYIEDKIGTNLIISRTKIGNEIISKLRNFHFEEGSVGEVIEAQSERYALGSIGESMKHFRPGKKAYYPNHKRTNNVKDLRFYRFTFFDRLKIKHIKPLLCKRKFRLAKALYTVTITKTILKFILTRSAPKYFSDQFPNT